MDGRRVGSLIVLVAACVASLATAADYPVKPIKVISPYSPGGGNDLTLTFSGPLINAIL